MSSAALLAASNDYSSEYLSKEIQSAEKALAALRRQQERGNEDVDADDADLQFEDSRHLPASVRLNRLSAETEDLLFLQAVSQWADQKGDDDDMGNNDGDQYNNLLVQTNDCVRLGELLQERVNIVSDLFKTVYNREYIPLYEYLSEMLVRQVRRALQRAEYPKACKCKIWKQLQTDQDAVGPLLHAWERLEASYRSTVSHVEGSPPVSGLNPLVVELVRPLVERVHFHFLQTDKSRPTSTRLDRLPEWLFNYIKTHFLDEKGPWEVIYYGWRPSCAVDVLNEICRLAQFVVTERNLFRAEQALEPTVLCRSIAEILQFDDFMQSLVPSTSRLVSLTDSLVAGDEELLDWWLERERESLLGRLAAPSESQNDASAADAIESKYMAPQAEVFGAMIRSIRCKAALFTSHMYLQQVAGPLCMQFLDAVHNTATGLKENVLQTRKLPSPEALRENILSWIALLNGTRWCALILKGELSDDTPPVPNDDLLRFGQSLERLENAMISELIENLLGETLLLQKARLANYLMQTSHLLAGHVPDNDLVPTEDLSVDLLATQEVLSTIVDTCTSIVSAQPHHMYAPRLILDRILDWIAQKYLETLLDESLVTEILSVGGRMVRKDVLLLFGNLTELPPIALRLLDVTHALEDRHLASIGDALCGLAGQPPPLTIDLFSMDERLYDEAVSMIRAKGCLWLELNELLSVLNRRVDLSHPTAL